MANDTSTGATPGAGATLVQPGQSGEDAATSTATGEEALGEPGKAILREARRAAKEAETRAAAAEKERDDLRAATQTDQDKAISEAKKTTATEVAARYEGLIRRAVVRSELRAAGMTSDVALDAFASSPAFTSLKVRDDGSVDGVTAAIETMRTTAPELFAIPRQQMGTADGGVRGSAAPTDFNSQLRRAAGRA